jgi:hypothetical protein
MISGFDISKFPKLTSKVVLILSFIIIIIMYSCIFPYEPVIDKYENVLVVDGLLTNLPGNCFVRLSRTYKYNEKPDSVEKGARVLIIDEQDNKTQMKDNDDGVYLPEDSLFAGIIGMKYKLYIETAGGEIAESSMEELKEPVDIEEIYYTFKDKGNGIQGLQFFLDTYDRQHRSFYYSWDYEETWEFAVPYQSMSIYLPEMKICYKHISSRKISIQSTKDYSDDKVIGFPLYFIDNSTNRLSIKYSVLVRQYVLTEKTFEFYRDLKEINENTGTLFDRTPVILVGNMINKLNPDLPVLGNFQVSGTSEKRIFIHHEDLPAQMMVPTGYEFCEGDLFSKKHQSKQIDSLLRTGWVVMDTIYQDIDPDTLIGMVISRACFDCTMKGDIKKPDYWDEK